MQCLLHHLLQLPLWPVATAPGSDTDADADRLLFVQRGAQR
jgi:hypothetical protein